LPALETGKGLTVRIEYRCNCPAGYELLAKAFNDFSTCVLCPEGFYRRDDMVTCEPCAAGTYEDGQRTNCFLW
jgi:hypothetical protein